MGMLQSSEMYFFDNAERDYYFTKLSMVANARKAVVRQGIALSTHSEAFVDKSCSRYTVPLVNTFHLSLTKHRHCLYPAQCSSCIVEGLKSHHRFDNSSHVPMVLLNPVVQILALPQLGILY